ncbi:sulfotransferase 2A1-like [Rhynchocyon petersi]
MSSDYLVFDGIPFPQVTYNCEVITSVRDEFVVWDEDVITLSYPKSGTHWMLEIIGLICSKGDPKWVQSVSPYDRSPWIEVKETYPQLNNNTKDPRMYSSHLPIQLFPKSFLSSKAKAIYVIRNPRDVLTSGYHFYKAVKCVQNPESFDQYLDWFLQGNVSYGSWFDHVRGWLSMKGKDNFLIISYEDLHKDTRATVGKISQFLGKELSPEELNSVLKHISFNVMKDNKMSNFTLISDDVMDHSKGKLMRKGITGDWKNHFTVAQSEAFDKIYEEKMAGLPQGLFSWE